THQQPDTHLRALLESHQEEIRRLTAVQVEHARALAEAIASSKHQHNQHQQQGRATSVSFVEERKNPPFHPLNTLQRNRVPPPRRKPSGRPAGYVPVRDETQKVSAPERIKQGILKLVGGMRGSSASLQGNSPGGESEQPVPPVRRRTVSYGKLGVQYREGDEGDEGVSRKTSYATAVEGGMSRKVSLASRKASGAAYTAPRGSQQQQQSIPTIHVTEHTAETVSDPGASSHPSEDLASIVERTSEEAAQAGLNTAPRFDIRDVSRFVDEMELSPSSSAADLPTGPTHPDASLDAQIASIASQIQTLLHHRDAARARELTDLRTALSGLLGVHAARLAGLEQDELDRVAKERKEARERVREAEE
ncbi:hypothetical protein HK104_007932, partial [Borealophlyctis nickersoniae]